MLFSPYWAKAAIEKAHLGTITQPLGMFIAGKCEIRKSQYPIEEQTKILPNSSIFFPNRQDGILDGPYWFLCKSIVTYL